MIKVYNNFMPFGFAYDVVDVLNSESTPWRWGALSTESQRGTADSINWVTFPEKEQSFWRRLLLSVSEEMNNVAGELMSCISYRAVALTSGMFASRHMDEYYSNSDPNVLVALYYPMTLQPRDGGRLTIYNDDGSSFEHIPQENSMLIFSGFLVHEISCLTHHYANKLRLSINLKFASERTLSETNPQVNRIYLDEDQLHELDYSK